VAGFDSTPDTKAAGTIEDLRYNLSRLEANDYSI
jgi:hypothetical protein